MYWVAERTPDWEFDVWLQCQTIGFAAQDQNLFRYVGNNPTNLTDPSGLFADAKQGPPWIDLGKSAQGVGQGVLKWKLIPPTLPKGMRGYTMIDMNWEIKKPKNDPAPRKGKYNFWLEGIVVPMLDFGFNLSPYHGAPVGLNTAKVNPWESFKNRTELDAFLATQYNLKGTVGTLTVKLDYRGYKVAFTDKFSKTLEKEYGFPGEVVGETPNPGNPKSPERRICAPNRIRTPYRELAPWLATEPKGWKNKSDWNEAVELKVTWDWSGDSLVAKYEMATSSEKTMGDLKTMPPK